MTEMESGVTAVEVAGGAIPLLKQITSRRDERSDTEKFDIPTWDGDLKAEYQVLETEDIQAMIRRARASTNGNASNSTNADADFLSKACVGVYAYDAENDEEVRLTDGYTMDLAHMLDPKYPKGHPLEGEPVPIKSPRELIVYMFRWKGLVLASHGQDVGRWMQKMKKPTEDPS